MSPRLSGQTSTFCVVPLVSKSLLGINPFTPKSDLIDFPLSNARRFYSSKGDPSGMKGLRDKGNLRNLQF